MRSPYKDEYKGGMADSRDVDLLVDWLLEEMRVTGWQRCHFVVFDLSFALELDIRSFREVVHLVAKLQSS